MKIKSLLAIATVMVTLTACGDKPGERALSGAGIGAGAGAVGGALLGDPLTGAAIGAGAGAITGAATNRHQIDLGR